MRALVINLHNFSCTLDTSYEKNLVITFKKLHHEQDRY